jgi:hypothetical protein
LQEDIAPAVKAPAVWGDFYDYRSGSDELHVVRVVGWSSSAVFLQRVAIMPRPEEPRPDDDLSRGLVPVHVPVPVVSLMGVEWVLNEEWLLRNRATRFIDALPTEASFERDFCALDSAEHIEARAATILSSLVFFPTVLCSLVAAFSAPDPVPLALRPPFVPPPSLPREITAASSAHHLLRDEIYAASRFKPSPSPLMIRHSFFRPEPSVPDRFVEDFLPCPLTHLAYVNRHLSPSLAAAP